MAQVSFPSCTVLEVRKGINNSGNPWGRIKIMSSDYEIWECFCSSDVLPFITQVMQGQILNLTLEFRPNQYADAKGNIQNGVRVSVVDASY